jgi:hypothetical protein
MIKTYKEILLTSLRNVFYNFKFVFLLWGTNVFAAFIVSMPIYYIINDHLGNSAIGEFVSDEFSIFWLNQFRFIYSSNLAGIPLVLISTLIAYMLVQTFFVGGIISIFNQPSKNHSVDFFYGSVKYWYRFTKVMFTSLIFFVIAFLFNDLLGNFIGYIFANTENEFLDMILRSLRYIILIFLIGIVTIISDYVRVSIVVGDKQDVLKVIFDTIKFIKENFSITFSVFFVVAVLGALGSIIYNIISGTIARSPFYFLIISFIIQQLLIIFRFFVRMLFFATEVYIFKDKISDIIEIEN